MRERQQLDDGITSVRSFEKQLEENIELIELGEMEGDQEIINDAENALKAMLAEANRRQVEAMLSGEADGNDTYLEVHSGAGGTESQDWANMLLRMYTRWAERQGYKVEVLEMHHNKKVDAPSGTALLLGAEAAKGRGIELAANAVKVRDGHTGAREQGSIGFATLRGGGVIGDHSVLFSSEAEMITLSHRAMDRSLFAKGAVTAARWAFDKKPGFYNMLDVLGMAD